MILLNHGYYNCLSNQVQPNGKLLEAEFVLSGH